MTVQLKVLKTVDEVNDFIKDKFVIRITQNEGNFLVVYIVKRLKDNIVTEEYNEK